jgi:ABC-2 type transport system ATP-binding protein
VAEEGVTVFVNTHHLAEAERLCDLVGVIRSGRLLALGHPDELRSEAGGRRVEIVGAGIGEPLLAVLRARADVDGLEAGEGRLALELGDNASVPEIVRLAVESGVAIEEVRRGTESLEDAFMSLLEEADEGAR